MTGSCLCRHYRVQQRLERLNLLTDFPRHPPQEGVDYAVTRRHQPRLIPLSTPTPTATPVRAIATRSRTRRTTSVGCGEAPPARHRLLHMETHTAIPTRTVHKPPFDITPTISRNGTRLGAREHTVTSSTASTLICPHMAPQRHHRPHGCSCNAPRGLHRVPRGRHCPMRTRTPRMCTGVALAPRLMATDRPADASPEAHSRRMRLCCAAASRACSAVPRSTNAGGVSRPAGAVAARIRSRAAGT